MSTKLVQSQAVALYSGLSIAGTSMRITPNPTDLDGTKLTMADFGGTIGYATIDPGIANYEEIVSFTGITDNGDGTATLTGLTRNLISKFPYTTAGTGKQHGASAVVVFSDNPQVWNKVPFLANDNTFTGLNLFSGYAPQTDTDPTAGNDMVRLSYLQALVLGTLTTIDLKVPGTAGETLADGDSIYLKTSDNRWWKTDADTASTVNNVLLGIAQGAGTAGNAITNGVLLQGVDDAQSGLTGGAVQYASNTAGDISATPGTIEVTLGIAKSATELYFCPRFDQMITEDQQDAMDGATSPSASNVFITNNDTSATPSANKIAKYDANGNLSISNLYTSLLCAETLAVGNLVSASHYQADGGATYDNKGTFSGAAGGASVTQAYTVGGGSNRVLIVFIGSFLSTSNAPTYNGVAMTAGTSNPIALGGGQYGQYFYLLNPASGANNIVFSNNAGNNWSMSVLSYSKVTAIDVSVATLAASQVVTTVNDGALIVSCLMSTQAGSTPTSPVNMGNNNQTVASGNGPKMVSGDSGIIMPKLPTTVSGSTTDAVFSMALQPVTAPSFGYAVKGSASTATGGAANFNKYASLVGFVTAVTNGGVVGETATIQTQGVVTGLSNLVPLATYYLQDSAGTIGTTAGTNSKKIGVALTTTTLLIKQDN